MMIDQGNENVYENDLKFTYGMMDQMEAGVIPMYVPSGLMDMNYTIPKRRRDDSFSFDPSVSSFPYGEFVDQSQFDNRNGMFMFLGEDISMQIFQQQLEIDRFISQHTEKMRSEIEASRRTIAMRLIAITEERLKRLRTKEDEIIKIGRLNHVLEQKVKSLHVDNQIWQQMAQSNESTANILRFNLQQIQQQQQQQLLTGKHVGDTIDDVESCCGSNYDDEQQRTLENNERCMLAKGDDVEGYWGDKNGRRKWCRNCGKEELGVLLLPCRHLCVCTVCESSINVCPICKSTKNDSVHVNMNSF